MAERGASAMRLKDLREDADMTQQQMADLLHVRQNTYSQYENGQRQIPIASLIVVAKYFQVSTDYLLGLTEIETPFLKS